MKKKQIANLIMVVVILLIVAAGVLGVGHIKGWFDSDDGTYATLSDIRGIVNIERDGVAYQVEKDTVLRADDKISCDIGATAVIKVDNDILALGENGSVTVIDPSVTNFSLEINLGEVFADCENAISILFSGKETSLSKTTALISVRKGTQSISVLRGEVDGTKSAQVLSYIDDEKSVYDLDINSLSDFAITQILNFSDKLNLCFTTDELNDVIAKRQQELIGSEDDTSSETATKSSDDVSSSGDVSSTDKGSSEKTTASKDASSEKTTSSKSNTTTKKSDSGKNTTTSKTTTSKTTTSKTTTSKTTTTTAATGKCTITIRCDTILNNMSDLKPEKAEFVPANGVILPTVSVNFKKGETVFDVLKRACASSNIQLEYSMNPIFGSYYIEGINNLYEKDCGEDSGWMYKVNGWFPNYGCSDYTLSDGDVIVWTYTCKGIGADVGA